MKYNGFYVKISPDTDLHREDKRYMIGKALASEQLSAAVRKLFLL